MPHNPASTNPVLGGDIYRGSLLQRRAEDVVAMVDLFSELAAKTADVVSSVQPWQKVTGTPRSGLSGLGLGEGGAERAAEILRHRPCVARLAVEAAQAYAPAGAAAQHHVVQLRLEAADHAGCHRFFL